MDFTVAEIERLIYELYHNPSSQALANKYLTLAQCSPNSWTFAWTLLDHSKPVEVQYFGASSLHLKISRNWHELPNDEYKLDLRNRLMECLLRTVQGQNSSRIVQTRLCVALAAYVVQTVSNFWPSAIQDLVSNFSPEKNSSITIPPLRSVLMLVETLMMIPEEFHVIFMSQQEKSLCRNALAKGVNDVFQFIDSVMRTDKQTITLEIKQAAIKCFANWSQHLGPLILGDGHERILDLILYNVNDDDLSAYSVDAISSIYSHPEIHKYPNTVLKLISKLNYLTPVLEAAINDQDGDKCLVLYSLFIQIGETHSRLLLDTVYDKPEYREPISQMITVILKCSATPGYYPIDETCSETAFNFWYTFQDDIIASGQDRIFFYLEMFKPLYEALIDALLRKVQFPPDDIYDQEWNSEDKEAFRCYRQDIGDTFMYCYNMLRTTMLSCLVTHFGLGLKELQVPNQGRTWQYLEAVIYSLTSIAENVEQSEQVYLNQIFEALQHIPFASLTSQKLLASTMEMLGAYSEWIYEHSDLLPKVLSLLFMGLKGEQVAIVSATLALKDITRECQKQIEPYVEQILAACEEGLRPESRLKAKERSRLMCTVGQVLTLLPYEGTLSYLNQLLPPILHNLELSLQCQPGMDNYFPVHNDVISNLNVLSMLFGSLDPDYVKQDASNMAVEVPRRANPIFPVFQQTLPLLANVGLKWIGEETVIESLCECLKKAVVTLLDEVRPLVLSVIDLTTRLYSISYQHPLLDIMKQIITLFGSDAELRGSIIQSFAQMVSQTISVCSTDLKSRTYLVEHFYALSAVLMKKKADIFQVLSANNEPLFRLATSCILLHERPSVKSSTLFLTEFINKSTETRDMELIVKTNGGDLVSNCLLLIGGTCDSPRNVVEFAADVLLVLNQRYFECLTDWFNIVVTNDNYPTEKVRKSDLEAFCRSVLRERKNKRKLKELCCEFSLLCRGLLGTDYALQSTAKF